MRSPTWAAFITKPTSSRLYIAAQLFEVEHPAIETARVLELGCGDGSNIIYMAAELPNATFRRSRRFCSAKSSAELPSVTMQVSAMLSSSLGISLPFKITANSTISCATACSPWVPEAVQTAILECCKSALSPNGIAYVSSYNTNPAWKNARHRQRHDAISRLSHARG